MKLDKKQKIQKRAEDLAIWLDKNGKECQIRQNHLVENSMEKIYWHYGYSTALFDILKLLNEENIIPN